jgi:alanine racemase
LKLDYTVEQCSAIFGQPEIRFCTDEIIRVSTDSRKINLGKNTLFVALRSPKRSGASFIENAYKSGVRLFVIHKDDPTFNFPDVTIWRVDDTLFALQELAKHHRKKFHYPVVIITGSLGKTTFKEWAFHCLSATKSVVRSPKSFNSQLGVALSLLEMHPDAQIALIEAGISKPGEMARLEEIVAPTLGVFTHFGLAHREFFKDAEEHLQEKLKAFVHCQRCFVSEATFPHTTYLPSNFQVVPKGTGDRLSHLRELLVAFLRFLHIEEHLIQSSLQRLPVLAMRMETFEGINGNLIINDTYNLDTEALMEALHLQKTLAGNNRKRVVILGISPSKLAEKDSLKHMVETFTPDHFLLLESQQTIPWNEFHNSVILVKAHRDCQLELQIKQGKAIRHQTHVEVNLSAIEHNIRFFKHHLAAGVKMLCMVKADAYGAGAIRVASFLEQCGVDAFGVAFADEGAELRKNGIRLPIVIMNPDPEHIDLLIDHDLQPAVYSFEQMDELIRAMIDRGITGLPVHLKFDTGMHRLGFAPEDAAAVWSIIQAQPELKVVGVYSHLADADNADHQAFTEMQITRFKEVVTFFSKHQSEDFTAHLLNSEGALRYKADSFDMVRLGISMYGFTDNIGLKCNLRSAISWHSTVSQTKLIPAGETIGYGCSYVAEKSLRIAIIPVGYADGYRRKLSNGIGGVWIQNTFCPIVGRVCMDMIMVEVPESVQAGDAVELIGSHIPMEQFAGWLETIPYEVMTGLSMRMARTYVLE